MPAALNYYHVLDTSSSASFRELKKQYFQRAKECHPDLHDGSAAKEEQFKLLVLAFEVLSDPHKRQQYDATLQVSKGAPIDLHGPVAARPPGTDSLWDQNSTPTRTP